MSWQNIVVYLVLAACACFVVSRLCRRARRKQSCGCGCPAAGGCSGCPVSQECARAVKDKCDCEHAEAKDE